MKQTVWLLITVVVHVQQNNKLSCSGLRAYTHSDIGYYFLQDTFILSQQRFCMWGLLPEHATNNLNGATNSSSSGATATNTSTLPQLPSYGNMHCPGTSSWSNNMSVGSVNPLVDRSTWWLPIAFRPLTMDGSSSQLHWVTLSSANQTVDVELPEDAAAATLMALQGDSASGLYHVRYSRAYRKRLRQGIMTLANVSSSTSNSSGMDNAYAAGLLQAGSILSNQLELALSPFGGVPGEEVVDILSTGRYFVANFQHCSAFAL